MHSQVGPQSIIHISDVIKLSFSFTPPAIFSIISETWWKMYFFFSHAMLSFFVPVFLSTSNYFSLVFLLIVKGQSVHPNVKKVYVAPTTWLNLSVLRCSCVTLP